jgi:hypothetical protein
MKTEKSPNTLLAFLISPLIVPLVVLFVSVLPFPGQNVSAVANPISFLTGLLFFAIFALPCAYVTELLLGIPAWLVFRRQGIRSLPAFAGGGVFIGLVFYLSVEFGTKMLSPSTQQLREQYNISASPFSDPYFYISLAGATASAVLFRFIVFRRKSS